jgi:hypothetical protein
LSVKQTILKHRKKALFIGLYLVFLIGVLFFFKVGTPPRGDVGVYKGIVKGDNTGFWGLTILFSAPAIKEGGVNIVIDEVPFFVDYDGNVREFPFFRQIIMHNIKAAHRSGLRYGFVLQETYIPGRPGGITIPERAWPTFFPQWNEMILKYAALAERNGVEIFGPWVEGECALGLEILVEDDSIRGYEKASDWGQEILYKIKERYSGNVLWRAGITQVGPERPDSNARWDTFRDEVYMNFTGYDYIGFTIYPNWVADFVHGDPDSERRYRDYMNEVIDYLLEIAERDGCKGVIATEFAEERVFEEGLGKLSGFFYYFTEPAKIWYSERFP